MTFSRARILVVEDNPANQTLLKFTLMAAGHNVDVAANAQEALLAIEKNRPDLILMDIQLPGLDGLSFTRQLKADPATASLVIVAVTARAMTGDRERCLAAGCSGYVSKPIDTRTLASQIALFLP